jgi:hypothetical protein
MRLKVITSAACFIENKTNGKKIKFLCCNDTQHIPIEYHKEKMGISKSKMLSIPKE